MKVAYISGPIAGHGALNEPLFRAAERRLLAPHNPLPRQYGRVIVPHDVPPWEHEGDCPASYVKNGDHTAACYLREDLLAMLADAHDVWMLPGWEASVGARLELQVAAACGLGIKFFHAEELGCPHNGYERRKCEDSSCWNSRVQNPVPAEAAVRRSRGSIIHLPDMLNAPTPLGACAHRLYGSTTHCAEIVCPNYYGRHAGS